MKNETVDAHRFGAKGSETIILREKAGRWCEVTVRLEDRDGCKRLSISGSEGSIVTRTAAKRMARESWESFFEDAPEDFSRMIKDYGVRSVKGAARKVVEVDGELHGIDVQPRGRQSGLPHGGLRSDRRRDQVVVPRGRALPQVAPQRRAARVRAPRGARRDLDVASGCSLPRLRLQARVGVEVPGAPGGRRGVGGGVWEGALNCAHPGELVPDADTMLAQKLMLEADEPAFLRVANRHW